MEEPVLEPGCKVRVANPKHWLFDKVGHTVRMTHAGMVKKVVATGASPGESVGVPVDFEKSLSGWHEGPFGRLKRKTHNCDGALKKPTGYYILVRELIILDVPGGTFRKRSEGGIVVSGT